MREIMEKFENSLMEMKSDLLLLKQKGIFHLDTPISQLTEDSRVHIKFNKEAYYKVLKDESFYAKLHCIAKKKES